MVAAAAAWLSLSEIDSGNGQFDAGMPGQPAPSVAPIDFEPNGIRVYDCPDAAPVVGAQQHGIADNRMARIASDNHWPRPPDRYLISATNNRPWLSTTTQE
jgi:hypothetical protein